MPTSQLMKKLLTITVLGLLLSVPVYSHDEERFIFLNCKGDFPTGLPSDYNDEIIKIDLKQSKIIFEDGYEYIAKKKWNKEDDNFQSYAGVRTGGVLGELDHAEYFVINRFSGEGTFFYAKTKVSKWKLMKKTFKVKCTKVKKVF